ncbi:serpentine type 7TM GPCR chemoreceptor srh domain-containing protein [Ditylenchus destructor]|nr:serpentine type 7TM GPCR chemoreceptor srh domain-containing protein [Ditylenchus destructor]
MFDFLKFNGTQLIEFNVFRLVFDVIAAADIGLQLYNLVVMFIATPKTMIDYRFYLCFQTLGDLLFEIWFGIILAPRVSGEDNCFVFRGPMRESTDPAKLKAAGFLAFSLSRVAYCYLYRLIAHDTTVPKKLNRPLKVRLIMNGAPTTIWWCIDLHSKMVWFYTIGAFFIASQLVNIVGGIVIIRMISVSAQQLTKETYKLHMQLSIVLLIQGAVPFVCIFLPLSFFSCIFFFKGFSNALKEKFGSGEYGVIPTLRKICLVMISLFPLINALLNIVFIRPYRHFTKNLVRRIFCPFKNRYRVTPADTPQRNDGMTISDVQTNNVSPALTS